MTQPICKICNPNGNVIDSNKIAYLRYQDRIIGTIDNITFGTDYGFCSQVIIDKNYCNLQAWELTLDYNIFSISIVKDTNILLQNVKISELSGVTHVKDEIKILHMSFTYL